MKNDKYKMCVRCVMDTSDPDIVFDENGVCNHCKSYGERIKNEVHCDAAGKEKLLKLVDRIKKDNKNKSYDCIIGVSGGVDSSFVAHKTKEMGLRPLAVHLDNGWDSELAVGNIEKMLKQMSIDLYTYVLDWEEFKDLQLSFLRSSLVDCEIPTDHAILALMYQQASKRGIRYIFGGNNIVTEAVMPVSWARFKADKMLINSVQAKFGNKKLKRFLKIGLLDLAFYTLVKRIKMVPLLNYLPYDKQGAKKIMEEKYNWKDYGGKHYESIYTRFYQGYILPNKFGIDKRKAHYSALICAGQMTRLQALELLKTSTYENVDKLREDKEYVIKKLGITPQDFEDIMKIPPKEYSDYANEYVFYSKLKFISKWGKKIAIAN